MAFIRNQKKKKIFSIFENKNIQKITIGLVFLFTITMLIYTSSSLKKYDVQVGDIASEDIVVNKEAVNTIATQKLKQVAAESVPKKFTLDQNVILQVKDDITHIFNAIRQVQEKSNLEDKEKINTLKNLIAKELSEETYNTAIKLDSSTLKELETITKAIMEKVMEDGVKEDSIDRAKSYIIEEFKKVKMPEDVKNIGEDIAFSVIRCNMVYDKEATERLQQEAMSSVEPVKISKDQVIIKKGTIITNEHWSLLKELGLLTKDKMSSLSLLFGSILLVLILEGILVIYIYFLYKNIYENNMYIALLALVIISTLIISMGFKTISNYLIPLAAGSMLISIFINPHISLVSSFVMSILIGVMLGNDFAFALVAFIGAIVGIYCTIRVSQRSDLTIAGGIIGIVNFIVILALSLLNNVPTLEAIRQCPWGFINGILSSVLTIGTLPFLEIAFGITTSIKLLELSNPTQPLLRKLMVDAPGTYHHSIIVGNLAEAAAEAIGADSLLARVGANYHDIGKIKRPYFFIENQLTSENPHDKLNPSLSALIITSHVKDGLDIAREYRLPLDIQVFIEQHHGTTLLSYFYKKAVEQCEDKKVSEASFRYEGPKPQSKEVAIVMLADSAEAAVRSMSKPTPGKIEGFIRQIIKDKLDDGQLDECDLTLKDLDKIAVAFSRVLTGVFHTRIEYPDKLKEIEKRNTKDA